LVFTDISIKSKEINENAGVMAETPLNFLNKGEQILSINHYNLRVFFMSHHYVKRMKCQK